MLLTQFSLTVMSIWIYSYFNFIWSHFHHFFFEFVQWTDPCSVFMTISNTASPHMNRTVTSAHTRGSDHRGLDALDQMSVPLTPGLQTPTRKLYLKLSSESRHHELTTTERQSIWVYICILCSKMWISVNGGLYLQCCRRTQGWRMWCRCSVLIVKSCLIKLSLHIGTSLKCLKILSHCERCICGIIVAL